MSKTVKYLTIALCTGFLGLFSASTMAHCRYNTTVVGGPTYCGYEVGSVPAGMCSPCMARPVSTYCGYQIGTVPAGKCAVGCTQVRVVDLGGRG